MDSDNNSYKRERGKNYTEREKRLVLEIARKYVDIIDSRKTDTKTNRKKIETWDKIAEEFGRTAENGPRTGHQIKALYQSLKKLARRDILNGNKDFVFLAEFVNNDTSNHEEESFTPKMEPDDDSCFEVTEHLLGDLENSCSSSNFNSENRFGQNNYSTPIAIGEKRNNEVNFSSHKVTLNFNNASDSQSNISSTSRENTPLFKKERGKNYTEVEKQHFLNICSKYTDIIELTENDQHTLKRKNDAWDRILNEYNTIAETGFRNKEKLKYLYFSLKKTIKNLNTTNEESDAHIIESEAHLINGKILNNDHGTTGNPNNIREEIRSYSRNDESGKELNNDCTRHDEGAEAGVKIKTEPPEPSFTEAEPPSLEKTIEQVQNETQIVQQHSQVIIEQSAKTQTNVPQQRHEPIPESSAKRKRPNDKTYRENVDRVKYEILLIRKEKEELQRDLLLMDLRKKELEIKEKEYQLKSMNII